MEKVTENYIVESCIDINKANGLKNYISLLREENLHGRILEYMKLKHKFTFKLLFFLFGSKYVNDYVLQLIKNKIETKFIDKLIK